MTLINEGEKTSCFASIKSLGHQIQKLEEQKKSQHYETREIIKKTENVKFSSYTCIMNMLSLARQVDKLKKNVRN